MEMGSGIPVRPPEFTPQATEASIHVPSGPRVPHVIPQPRLYALFWIDSGAKPPRAAGQISGVQRLRPRNSCVLSYNQHLSRRLSLQQPIVRGRSVRTGPLRRSWTG